MENQNTEMNQENKAQVIEVDKPSLKDRISNIKWKKVLKVGGIVAGIGAAALFLGKCSSDRLESECEEAEQALLGNLDDEDE